MAESELGGDTEPERGVFFRKEFSTLTVSKIGDSVEREEQHFTHICDLVLDNSSLLREYLFSMVYKLDWHNTSLQPLGNFY